MLRHIPSFFFNNLIILRFNVIFLRAKNTISPFASSLLHEVRMNIVKPSYKAETAIQE